MKVTQTGRGFNIIEIPTYANEPVMERLIQESSAVGDYGNSWDKPGSSFLWVGKDHHLNREEVKELIDHMKTWLKKGNLSNG